MEDSHNPDADRSKPASSQNDDMPMTSTLSSDIDNDEKMSSANSTLEDKDSSTTESVKDIKHIFPNELMSSITDRNLTFEKDSSSQQCTSKPDQIDLDQQESVIDLSELRSDSEKMKSVESESTGTSTLEKNPFLNTLLDKPDELMSSSTDQNLTFEKDSLSHQFTSKPDQISQDKQESVIDLDKPDELMSSNTDQNLTFEKDSSSHQCTSKPDQISQDEQESVMDLDKPDELMSSNTDRNLTSEKDSSSQQCTSKPDQIGQDQQESVIDLSRTMSGLCSDSEEVKSVQSESTGTSTLQNNALFLYPLLDKPDELMSSHIDRNLTFEKESSSHQCTSKPDQISQDEQESVIDLSRTTSGLRSDSEKVKPVETEGTTSTLEKNPFLNALLDKPMDTRDESKPVDFSQGFLNQMLAGDTEYVSPTKRRRISSENIPFAIEVDQKPLGAYSMRTPPAPLPRKKAIVRQLSLPKCRRQVETGYLRPKVAQASTKNPMSPLRKTIRPRPERTKPLFRSACEYLLYALRDPTLGEISEKVERRVKKEMILLYNEMEGCEQRVKELGEKKAQNCAFVQGIILDARNGDRDVCLKTGRKRMSEIIDKLIETEINKNKSSTWSSSEDDSPTSPGMDERGWQFDNPFDLEDFTSPLENPYLQKYCMDDYHEDYPESPPSDSLDGSDVENDDYSGFSEDDDNVPPPEDFECKSSGDEKTKKDEIPETLEEKLLPASSESLSTQTHFTDHSETDPMSSIDQKSTKIDFKKSYLGKTDVQKDSDNSAEGTVDIVERILKQNAQSWKEELPGLFVKESNLMSLFLEESDGIKPTTESVQTPAQRGVKIPGAPEDVNEPSRGGVIKPGVTEDAQESSQREVKGTGVPEDDQTPSLGIVQKPGVPKEVQVPSRGGIKRPGIFKDVQTLYHGGAKKPGIPENAQESSQGEVRAPGVPKDLKMTSCERVKTPRVPEDVQVPSRGDVKTPGVPEDVKLLSRGGVKRQGEDVLESPRKRKLSEGEVFPVSIKTPALFSDPGVKRSIFKNEAELGNCEKEGSSSSVCEKEGSSSSVCEKEGSSSSVCEEEGSSSSLVWEEEGSSSSLVYEEEGSSSSLVFEKDSDVDSGASEKGTESNAYQQACLMDLFDYLCEIEKDIIRAKKNIQLLDRELKKEESILRRLKLLIIRKEKQYGIIKRDYKTVRRDVNDEENIDRRTDEEKFMFHCMKMYEKERERYRVKNAERCSREMQNTEKHDKEVLGTKNTETLSKIQEAKNVEKHAEEIQESIDTEKHAEERKEANIAEKHAKEEQETKNTETYSVIQEAKDTDKYAEDIQETKDGEIDKIYCNEMDVKDIEEANDTDINMVD